MGKERDESGKFIEVVSDGDIVDYLQNTGGASTSEVADEFDYERPTAYRRLSSLEEEEQVQSFKIGNSLLWKAKDEAQTD